MPFNPFIYQKKDPNNSSLLRWTTRVKINGKLVTVALRLMAPGSKRLARQRAIDLQRELDSGILGESTQEWLGEKTTHKLAGLIAGIGMPSQDPASPSCWQTACDGYLRANLSKDTKPDNPNSARGPVNRTLQSRLFTIRGMSKWLIANNIPFNRSFTTSLILYIEHRKQEGIKSSSIWAVDFGYGVHWGDWMHSKGLCEKPNRELIKEHMPRKINPVVVLPEPEKDIESLAFFRSLLSDTTSKHPWANMRYWSAWSLLLCVRGLGCRPTEASTLLWEHVNMDKGTVVILETKTGVSRKIPILFQWVSDGLAELKTTFPSRKAICCSSHGRPWVADAGMSQTMRDICKAHGRKTYNLKRAQKLYIAQLISAGFPPHVVAKWTGHTLSVQEKHYCEDNSYLPSDHAIDYAEFGVMTEWGQRVKEHLTSFVRDLI